MNSRERVMTALHLKEPDRVPFMDFVDTIVKQKIMGTEEIDEAEFAKKSEWTPFTLQTTVRRCFAKAIPETKMCPRHSG